MRDFSFEIDYLALMISVVSLVIGYFLWRKSRSFAQPGLFFSTVDPSLAPQKDWKTRLVKLPYLLNLMALFFFSGGIYRSSFFSSKEASYFHKG